MNSRSVEALVVHRAGHRAGLLSRIVGGARFAYDAGYVAAHRGDPSHAIALRMPVRPEPYDVLGVNLHPFFAGLLPEGLRLRTLVRAVKTSEDDLYSLLAAVGQDAIGDVAATVGAQPPADRAVEWDPRERENVRFRELLGRSLDFGSAVQATFSGVQPKLSAAMISFPVRSPSRRRSYLLKLAPAEYPRLVENECFFMRLAVEAGLEVAPVELVGDRDGESGLLVERFDRIARADGSFARCHVEDACQLLDRYPADKYRLQLADVADALEVCSAPLVARRELLRLQAFSYAIANGDLHAKNVSVRTRGSVIELAPAYDLVSTLPYGDAKLALKLEGRDENVRARHFLQFGERIGVRQPATRRVLDDVVEAVRPALARLAEIGLDARSTRHLERTVARRLDAMAEA